MGGSGKQVSLDGAQYNGTIGVIGDKAHEVGDGVRGVGQDLELSDEYESGINDPQQKQQHRLPSPPIVEWEKILPVRSLKVLLVESDDSTRQVVSALLRNCSYEVTATSSGLQAWKVLENGTNHIDLVLTEVSMPGISGISLLSKIMSSDSCKNIPVIMMSSSDSVSTVFKCLSKGAVDFLVKPIRKNELKNLWQHVWRRSHSSSGSVSESGIQTEKSTKSRSGNESDNNSSNNDQHDNASIGLNARNGSDNGSGTQSSWTKHAVEVESPQPTSPLDQLGTDPPDSTCALVISDSELVCKNWVSTAANEDCQAQNIHTDALMGKDLEIGVPRNSGTQSISKQPEELGTNEDALELERNNAVEEPGTEAADLIGAIANKTDDPLVDPGKEKNKDGAVELPSLQLSLKRLRSTGDNGKVPLDDRNILRRSDQSAFSRYRACAVPSQAPTGNVGSCSPLNHSSEGVKTESTQNLNQNLDATKQGSNGSSENDDKGSTTNPVAYKEKALPTENTHPSAFHPVQARISQQVTQEKNDNNVAGAAAAGSSSRAQRQCQVQHHHHHYHHHHHHVHGQQQQQQQKQSENGSSSIKNKNVIVAANMNYSLNGSNSGSNHWSNGQNGSSADVGTGANAEIVNAGVVVSNGNGSGNVNGNSSGVIQNRLALREAALNKFRQKRKQRNFGKKVRYQSRKRLAEQRPRVRGQFVRQPDTRTRGPDS